ncbi:MAG: MarR family transcriptional regulator [Thermoprotei archaeon]
MRKEASRELRRVGLKSVDFVVLKTLSTGSTTQSRLAERLGLTKAAITYTIDRLETRGLVRRERNTGDRRRTVVTLTKKGGRVLSRAEHLYLYSLRKKLETFDHEDISTLHKTLEKLVNLFAKKGARKEVNNAYN